MTDYQLLPDLTPEEYAALKADIAKRGYDPAHPIVVDEQGNTLDGHHRQAICRELGITPPTVTRSGLTEQQKLEYALSANLRRRHLGQDERRALVRRLSEHTGWSVRAIERATGIPKSTVARYLAPVPSGTPEDAYLQRRAEAAALIASLGFGADDALVHQLAERVLLQEAARGLLRHGVTDIPPTGWKPVAYDARNRLIRERNRLAEWDIRVAREAGAFLNWCELAGIKFDNKRVQLPDRLRYPVERGEPPLPPEWDADAEHQAALGHFYFWWLTRNELREVDAGQGLLHPGDSVVSGEPAEPGPPRSRLRGPLGAQQNARRQRAYRQRKGNP